MHPAFLDNMSWEMAEVYGAIQDQILINLARHFPYFEAEDLPKSAFAYQAQMLAQMGQVNQETIRIIKNGLSGADEALKNSLEQAIIDSIKSTEPELLEGVKKGLLSMPTTPVVAPNQMRAFQLYYKQAADKLNMVNTVMLESTQQAYAQAVSDVVNELWVSDSMGRIQTALDTAAGEVVTGVSSWNQALKHATDRMKETGITGFIDHAGRHWSAEAYTAMDIRTTMFNTGRAAVWETNQDFGNDLYLVSYHNGARPLCYPWQNKVISSMDSSRTVIDLDGNEIQVIPQSSTSYGQPAGLFGINCKHYPTPFIPGVSLADGKPQDKEDNDRVYAESQEQRRLERKIREEKRDILMAKAQGAPQEEIDRLTAKARQSSADIDEFCKQTGRARHRDREAVYTKREFPDSKKYDVTTFTNQQKDLIDKWYRDGGEQQEFTFGEMKTNEPLVPKQKVVENVASQATQTRQKVDKTESEKLDATNFPDSFNKKKTKTFVETVNATEGTDPDVVKLFNKMGEQVNGQAYPITISYTEEGHAVAEYVYNYGGNRAKINVKVPKLIDEKYIRSEVGTTAHEWGHLFDHLNSEKGNLSYAFNDHALSNAIQNARPMSERVERLIADAIKDGKAAEEIVKSAIKADIDAISEEISKAISDKNYGEYAKLAKKRDKMWNDMARAASKASREAHDGRNAIEDIYDAISGGTLRDKTSGMYGHGSKYYGMNPGGENASAETFANYVSLALAYPELFKLMAEEQPEIWEACANIVKEMLGG